MHSKTTIQPKNKQDKESKEKITTPRNVYPVRSNMTYSEGEIDLSNPLSMSSYKKIQMSYKKLASTSSQRTTLISTHFPNLINEQDTHEFSLSQGVYNCFPTLKSNPPKDNQPLAFDFTKNLLFWFYKNHPSCSQKTLHSCVSQPHESLLKRL